MSIMVPFGDLKRHTASVQRELDEAAARVIGSGWYVLGPEVRAFEQEFAAYCGVNHCVTVANGTEALYLALVAMGIGPGDEVITVANAAVYEALTILQAGAHPVFIDVDEQTHTMDPSLIERAITARTRAIVPVHLYGRVADMEAILSVAERHGLPVLEDCAQAHGAAQRGRRAGSFGVAAAFSFYPTKNLGALGDGGAVVTDDATLAERLRQLREYGWERKYFTRLAGGLNSRLDEMQAAFLRAKLPHLERWNARRREIAARYTSELATTSLTLPEPVGEDDVHVYHLYVVRSRQRERVQHALRERKIGTDIHYPLPAHQQPVYSQYAPVGGLPITEQLSREIFSLPMYPELTDDDVSAVIAAVREATR